MRFAEALLGSARPVVMEIKMRSGAGRALVAGRDPTGIAAAYEQAGAPCLSVVTGRWFGGTPALLAEIADRTTLPVLRKDFIVRESDLDESVRLGAAAVLLTAKLLPGAVLDALVGGALRRGLTPFVEVTSEAELTGLRQAADCVVAVNNKDIADRERGPADADRSRALLPALRASGTRCPVSASGLDDPRTAGELVRAGFAGVLVGTGLLKSDVDTWVAQFDQATGIGTSVANRQS